MAKAQTKTADPGFDLLPASTVSRRRLTICLKCAFDFFTKQLHLAPRTAYSELKSHVPEETDFSGASTARPHFFEEEGLKYCPYCNGSNRWFARFEAIRIDAHPSFEKARKKLWTALKKGGDRYTLWHPERTPMQIFSEWLERLKRRTDFEDDAWLRHTAIEYLQRTVPSMELDEAVAAGVRRVQLSRQIEGDWHYDREWLYVPPRAYGDMLLVQHLLSRSEMHGGRTFEGRLTLGELMARLRRIGYFEARSITAHEPFEALEQAVAGIVVSGPEAVYYAVDRGEYLEKLKAVYDKKRTTK